MNAFWRLRDRRTGGRTDGQPNALSRLCCRERRLNNALKINLLVYYTSSILFSRIGLYFFAFRTLTIMSVIARKHRTMHRLHFGSSLCSEKRRQSCDVTGAARLHRPTSVCCVDIRLVYSIMLSADALPTTHRPVSCTKVSPQKLYPTDEQKVSGRMKLRRQKSSGP